MNLDKSLDDLIPETRKSDPRRGPRQGRERVAPTPYARPTPRSTEDKWVHDAFKSSAADRRRAVGTSVASVAGTGAVFTGVSSRIEVVGLHYEVTPVDLKVNAFEHDSDQYDRSGRSKGEATMEYASYQQAKIAINKFDGAMTKGQTISIRLLAPISSSGRPDSALNGAPNGGSLLSRISGGQGRTVASPRGGRGGITRGIRASRGRGAPAGGGGRAPASQGDLDKDLDSFMKNGAANGADVDMA
ncbi:MAG: hypothetical protein TREMPRED_001394 [Tremellales sp. Tagirdzhanova-0007]|nr:MAG: hypothetical protein TREMPRED_001394 [Tremellales sp. Tagirdzhanova-0007]